MTYAPTTEIVTVAWLSGVTGLSSSMVSTRLPRDTSTWSAAGFVTVGNGLAGSTGGVVGGDIDPHSHLRSPVASIHTWALNPASAKPPWRKACHLAELIVAGCFDKPTVQRVLSLPTGYGAARVNSTWVAGEPRRVPGDEGAYAHYQFDLHVHWVPL